MHKLSIFVILFTLFFKILIVNSNAELVAHWNFNEGSGNTLYDSSGYNNNGTIYGATWEYEPLTGGALRFDGINDNVLVPHSPSLDVTKKFTITTWVYPESMPGFCPHIVGKMVSELGEGWMGSYWVTMHGSADKRWGFALSTNPGAIDHWASKYAPDKEWSLLTATFDDSLNVIKLYLNGNLINTFVENRDLMSNNYPVYIGRNNDYNNMRHFKGLIGDIKIYNHIVSEIVNTFSIQSAIYLDTDTRPDGFIDLIRVTIMDSVPDNFDFSNLASSITLPTGRNFAALTIGSFTATASGFDISVVQSKTENPNTAVDAGDKLIINKNTEIGNNSVILPTSTVIADGLAPVVIKGTFCPKKELNNPDLFDSLIVTFTENVEVPSSKEPFKFFDISGTFPNDYTMTLTPLDNTPKAEMKFKVDNIEKLYPENGDSLWIAGGNNIEDIISIVQGKDTKPSPLIVKPYPLILAVTTLNPVSLSNLTIHNDLVNKFNLGSDNEGALIIIDISGNIENPAGLSGELDVLDAVGNIVTKDIKAKYVEYIENNNKHSALVMVWDVRNRNGRLVGPAPYCGIVIIKNGNTVVENKRILIGVQN